MNLAGTSFPRISDAIARLTSTASLKNFAKAAGFRVIGSKIYVNVDGTPALIADKIGDTALSVGTKNGATVSVVEKGFGGFLHQTQFTFTDLPLTLLDSSAGGGVKIYDFPEGVITILAASGKVTEKTTSTLASTLNAGSTYNWGVGTTVQANGTLATTEQDILPTTNGTASATINVAGAASTGVRLSAPASFNGTSSPKSAYFNAGLATGTDIDGDATTIWNGTVNILWAFNGDL